MAQQVDARLGSENFTVTVRECGGLTFVDLGGVLDISCASTLRDALVAIDPGGGLDVRMDLTALRFIDSSGISGVVSACERIRAAGGTFSTTCGDGIVRRAIEVTGLSEYLQLDRFGPRPGAGAG